MKVCLWCDVHLNTGNIREVVRHLKVLHPDELERLLDAIVEYESLEPTEELEEPEEGEDLDLA